VGQAQIAQLTTVLPLLKATLKSAPCALEQANVISVRFATQPLDQQQRAHVLTDAPQRIQMTKQNALKANTVIPLFNASLIAPRTKIAQVKFARLLKEKNSRCVHLIVPLTMIALGLQKHLFATLLLRRVLQLHAQMKMIAHHTISVIPRLPLAKLLLVILTMSQHNALMNRFLLDIMHAPLMSVLFAPGIEIARDIVILLQDYVTMNVLLIPTVPITSFAKGN
jgi:hypothetical protein